MGQITHHMIVNNMYEFIVEMFAPTINARLGNQAYRALHEAIMACDTEAAEADSTHRDLEEHTLRGEAPDLTRTIVSFRCLLAGRAANGQVGLKVAPAGCA